MFRVKHSSGSVIKRVFQGSLRLLDEVPLRVDESGLLIRALTPDKNLMVEIVIPQAAFEEFEVDKETSVVVERASLLRVFKRATRRDSVLMIFEEGSRVLKVVLVNTRTGTERSYAVDIREVGIEPVGSIDVDLPVRFQIGSDDLRRVIRDAKLVNDSLDLTYSDGRIEVRSMSENKLFKQVLELDKPLYALESKEPHVSSRYDLGLLKAISASLVIADIAAVEFGTSLPMRISLGISDGSTITYWIAPRV